MTSRLRRRLHFLALCGAFVVLAWWLGGLLDRYFEADPGTSAAVILGATVLLVLVAGFAAAFRGRLAREPIAPTNAEIESHARLGEADLYDSIPDFDGGGDVGGSAE